MNGILPWPFNFCSERLFPSLFQNTGLGWMRAMQSPRFAKSKGNICISLSMVALLFKISGNVDHLTAGNPCSEEIWMNYAEVRPLILSQLHCKK